MPYRLQLRGLESPYRERDSGSSRELLEDRFCAWVLTHTSVRLAESLLVALLARPQSILAASPPTASFVRLFAA